MEPRVQDVAKVIRAIVLVWCTPLACLGSQEIPVSRPRIVVAPGYSLDGMLASDGKSNIAAWDSGRTKSMVFAARLRPDGHLRDDYEIQIAPPPGTFLSEAVGAMNSNTGTGDTMLIAARFLGAGPAHIGVARVSADGVPIDKEFQLVSEGDRPSAASNGAGFIVAAMTPRRDIEVTMLSPKLHVLNKEAILGGWPQVAANGERYLLTFVNENTLRGVIIENGVVGEPFEIAKTLHPGLIAAAGESWAVATYTDALEICAVTPDKKVACRKVAAPWPGYVHDIVAADDALVVAWSAESPNQRTLVPPPVIYDFHLTYVTRDAAAELNINPGAPPADDDVIVFRSAGDPLRVGRKGLVTGIAFALGTPAQSLYALLPSGDGAMALWGEVTADNSATELHATRFTSDGIDPNVHDRILGRAVLPLASDATNILLNDGKLIDPAGNVTRTLGLPRDTILAEWDGEQFVFFAPGFLHRGDEKFAVHAGYFGKLACADGACVLAWLENIDTRERSQTNVRVLHFRTDRRLSRARSMLIAAERGHLQTIGVAETAGELMVVWSDDVNRLLRGSIFARGGQTKMPFTIATPASETDSLFFQAGSARDSFVIVQNAWPVMGVRRLNSSSIDLQNGTARGVLEIGDRILVFYERDAPERPWASKSRAFVRFVE